MPPRFVRFRITNIANGVAYDELLEALSTQIALDDVRLLRHTFKLDPHTDGETQVAEMELPNDEAELIRGAMQQAKVFVQRLGITTVIHFTELQEPEGRCSELPAASNKAHDSASAPPGVTSSGALLPPLVARDSHRPVARVSSSGSLDDDGSDASSQGSRPSRLAPPGPARGAPDPGRGAPAVELERPVPRAASTAGGQGYSYSSQHRDAAGARDLAARDDVPWNAQGETSARGCSNLPQHRGAAGARDPAAHGERDGAPWDAHGETSARGCSNLPQHRGAAGARDPAAHGERDDAPWAAYGETSARGAAPWPARGDTSARGSGERPPFDGRAPGEPSWRPAGARDRTPGTQGGSPVDDGGVLEQAMDRGPELAYCTRFLDAPNGDPKLLRACTAPCALQ